MKIKLLIYFLFFFVVASIQTKINAPYTSLTRLSDKHASLDYILCCFIYMAFSNFLKLLIIRKEFAFSFQGITGETYNHDINQHLCVFGFGLFVLCNWSGQSITSSNLQRIDFHASLLHSCVPSLDVSQRLSDAKSFYFGKMSFCFCLR